MARRPYRTARQEHLGDALDDLMRRGVLRWRWAYAGSRAIYHVEMVGESEQAHGTVEAERIVLRSFESLGVKWLPVPQPGGEPQREETLRRISEL